MKHLTRLGVAVATGAAAFALGATAPAVAAAGGANQECPGHVYCPNVGGPSMNGNGGGHAYGRPDAGTAGKADSKFPPGQAPNAENDGNNGYECDGNQGIAKGNPAHTGCEDGQPTS